MTDFLRMFSWQFYLLSEFSPEICCKEIADEILFVLGFDVGPVAQIVANKLPIRLRQHRLNITMNYLIIFQTNGKLIFHIQFVV